MSFTAFLIDTDSAELYLNIAVIRQVYSCMEKTKRTINDDDDDDGDDNINKLSVPTINSMNNLKQRYR